MQDHQIKYICISETFKQRFTSWELSALGGVLNWRWEWMPANGHSRGLLMGIDDDSADVIPYEGSKHF